jgi:hypothetical protein
METLMRGTFKMVKQVAKVSTIGPTEKSMMASGRRESKMAMACGEEYSVTATWVSGEIVKLMAMVFISGKTEIDMKDHGMTVSSREKDLTSSLMEICFQENISRVNQKVKVYTSGRMVASILVSSKMA